MDTQTVLIVASISGLIVIIVITSLAKFFRSQTTKRLNMSVDATITEIRVEASSLSSWWTVIAACPDPQTKLPLIFRSPHIRFSPNYHVGEHITVHYEAGNPKHYRMELRQTPF